MRTIRALGPSCIHKESLFHVRAALETSIILKVEAEAVVAEVSYQVVENRVLFRVDDLVDSGLLGIS